MLINCYLIVLVIFDIFYLVISLVLSLKYYEDINEQKIYKYFYFYFCVFVDIWLNIFVCLMVMFILEWYVGVCYLIKGCVVCIFKRVWIIMCCVVLFVLIVILLEFLEQEVLELKNNENLIIIKIRFIEIGESRVYMVFYYWFIVVMFIFILFVVLLGFNIIFICLVCKVNCIRR